MKDIKWVVIGALILLIVGFLLGYLVFPRTKIEYKIRETNVDSTKIRTAPHYPQSL